MTDKHIFSTSILKTILSCLLAVMMVGALMPTATAAASESDLTFTLNSDGKSYTLSHCKDSIKGDLVIPAT